MCDAVNTATSPLCTENQPGTSTRPHLTACPCLQTANPYELLAYVERSIHITHQLYCLSPRRHGPPSPTGVAAAGRRAHMRLLSSVQSPLLTTPAARAMIEQEPPALDMVSRRCVLCRIPSQFALPASPTAANRSACSLRVPCCPSRGASWP